jgi:hypothetical protein
LDKEFGLGNYLWLSRNSNITICCLSPIWFNNNSIYASWLIFVVYWNFVICADISRNIVIRKELYKSANSQLDLLKIIGMAQMEKELLKRYKSISKYTSIPEELDKLDQAEIREIVHDMVNELSTIKKIRKS